jgi:hypothetical protein
MHVSDASLQPIAGVHGPEGMHAPLVHVDPALHAVVAEQVAGAQIAGLSASLLQVWPATLQSASAVQASALVSTISEHDVAAAAIPAVAIKEKTSRERSVLTSPSPTNCMVLIARSLGPPWSKPSRSIAAPC